MRMFVLLKTILKNLFSVPPTRLYPQIARNYFKNSRGKIAITIEQCIFCGICQRKCLTGALTVSKLEKKWTIDRLRCTACGCCVEQCPKKCLTMEQNYSPACTGKQQDTYPHA